MSRDIDFENEIDPIYDSIAKNAALSAALRQQVATQALVNPGADGAMVGMALMIMFAMEELDISIRDANAIMDRVRWLYTEGPNPLRKRAEGSV